MFSSHFVIQPFLRLSLLVSPIDSGWGSVSVRPYTATKLGARPETAMGAAPDRLSRCAASVGAVSRFRPPAPEDLLLFRTRAILSTANDATACTGCPGDGRPGRPRARRRRTCCPHATDRGAEAPSPPLGGRR